MALGSRILKSIPAIVANCCAALFAADASATVVRFATSLGNVDVRMYNAATPLTVANFLNYTAANQFDGTFIHRAPQNFVVQGGGFTLTPPSFANVVPSNAPVMNEPGISNIRGTIAMAKTGAGPNTATNQWFFNIDDNSANLDFQNGGFTVFGRIVGNGLSVIDAINALPKYNLEYPTHPDDATFGYVPLRGDNSQALANRLVYMNDVAPLNIPAGDYNIDGKVDAVDLALWKSSLGSTTNAAADGNGNGVVDGADFLIWQRTFGQNFGAPAAAAIAAVPEPAAATLALLAAAACGLARRRPRGD